MTDGERKDERIRKFYDEALPLGLQFLRLVRISGMTDMAGIEIDPKTGYIRIHLHETNIDCCRIHEDSTVRVGDWNG